MVNYPKVHMYDPYTWMAHHPSHPYVVKQYVTMSHVAQQFTMGCRRTFHFASVLFEIPTVIKFHVENPPPGGAPTGQPLAVTFQF